MTDTAPTLATGPTDDPPSRGIGRALGAGAVIGVLFVAVSAIALRNAEPTTAHYVGLSMLIFTTGAVGVLMRRNALVLFMCIELMLNAVNIAFAAFARLYAATEGAHGQAIVLFVMIVAAAEVAVGLAIIVLIFRRRHSTNVDDLSVLRW